MDKMIIKEKENSNEGLLLTGIGLEIMSLQDSIKEMEKILETYKEMLLKAMEENKVIKLTDEVNGIIVNYMPETTGGQVFNKKKFEEENLDMFLKYVTFDGKKKAHLRISKKRKN